MKNIFILKNLKEYNSNSLGSFYIIIAAIAFSSMAVCVKILSDSLPIIQIAFLRCLISLMFLLPFFYTYPVRKMLQTNKISLHFLRSVLGVIAMLCGFLALSVLPLSDNTAISFSRILFIIPLSIFILKEKPTLLLVFATFIGYIGLITIVGFRNNYIYLKGYFIALLGAFFIALVKILVKFLSVSQRTLTIQLWFSIFSSTILLVPAYIFWTNPNIQELVLLIIISILGTVAQTFSVKALRVGESTKIMPFDYSRIIFATIYGYLLFDYIPNTNLFIGSAIIIISSIFIFRINKKIL